MIVDKALLFDNHINLVCEVFLKLRMLPDKLFRIGKEKLIFGSMIKSQILYGTLVWIFCSRTA